MRCVRRFVRYRQPRSDKQPFAVAGDHQVSWMRPRARQLILHSQAWSSRNTLPLALGLAMRNGQRDIALTVAGRASVETQHFKETAKQTLTVPAARLDALRLERTDARRGFSAWYVRDRYMLPIKLSQHDGGNTQMEMVSDQ